jgi:hypothetical protein
VRGCVTDPAALVKADRLYETPEDATSFAEFIQSRSRISSTTLLKTQRRRDRYRTVIASILCCQSARRINSCFFSQCRPCDL